MQHHHTRCNTLATAHVKPASRLFVLCCLVHWVSMAIAGNQEPIYNGRSLSQWLAAMYPQAVSGPYLPEVAVHNMGTNALPKLVEWSSYQRLPPKRRGSAESATVLSGSTNDANLPPEELAERSVVAFRFLKGFARPAIPELTRLARTSSDQARADRCASSLAAIGPEALPSLLSLATNGPQMTRWYAIAALAHFYKTPAAASAVPVLVQCFHDESEEVADKAVDILARLGVPAVVVPALTNALQSPSPITRLRAARCLGAFDEEARVAIPALQVTLRDRNYGVRVAATNTLRGIAPEVFSNARPVQEGKRKER